MATRDIAEIIVDRILDDLRSRPFLSGPWREQNDEIREHVRRIWANRVRKILGAVGVACLSFLGFQITGSRCQRCGESFAS